MLYIIHPLQQNQETLPIKNLLVSERLSKGKKLLTLHSKMKDTLTALAGVYTSLLNHMSVKRYLILNIHHTILNKTIVRKYVHTTDTQSVWKDFQEHMKSSSKGASEKRRLTQYVTNTVLDDNYKGTTEQFALHFNEQFRQLEEISEESEHFPPQIKLQLLQNAVRPINDLRIVETLDEFQSITTGHGRSSSLKYQTYYDLLINACVRYDRTKKANVAKGGHIYQTTFSQSNDNFIDQIPSETPIGDPYMGMDTPSDEFYNINTNQSDPPMSARHKLQPRLQRSNPNTKPNTFPMKPARQKWTGLLKKLQFSFILISTLQRSTTLLALSDIFPKDCLFTCIFHSL